MTDEKPTTPSSVNDLLGYQLYAQTLWDRIQAAINKDPLQAESILPGDDPLVVGLFGEWGAGKSKLLALVQALAIEHSKETIAQHLRQNYAPITVPVFFQPWKYEHEEHLLVPMLLLILMALEESLKLAQTFDDKLIGKVRGGIEASIRSMGALVKTAKDAVSLVEPSSGLLMKIAEILADLLPKKSKSAQKARDFVAKGEGRDYYEIHRILGKVTRPGKYPEVAGNQFQDKDFGVNFVVFIDDLDRCLPEKAVGALELIKTIFNLESFAFVLALDEEVVERGIGHRYRDYALANKKPEMPITGFEYLEKIVHLPFRLPALSEQKALAFLREYEARLLQARVASLEIPSEQKTNEEKAAWKQAWLKQHTWFDLHMDQGDEPQNVSIGWNLADLVVKSFAAHVPRKLVRVVELFHQVLRVLEAQERMQHLRMSRGESDQDALDPRLLMAHVLLQLFQPELHRTMRRSINGFEILLDSFAPITYDTAFDAATEKKPVRQLSQSISDVDLLHWAVYWDGEPPATLRSAQLRVSKLSEADRHTAQRVRLVIAERLLEHRAQQRHAFDPLRLFAALHTSFDAHKATRLEGRYWFGLLAQVQGEQPQPLGLIVQLLEVLPVDATATGVRAVVSQELDGRIALQDVNAVYLALISSESAEQKRVAEVAGLQLGQKMASVSAQQLLAEIERRWLQGQVHQTDAASPPNEEAKAHLLRGLHHLSPYIAKEDGAAYWALVKDAVGYAPPSGEIGLEEYKDVQTIARRALWADVRAALWQDARFDPARLYLIKARHSSNSMGNEPIPGFVHIPAGRYRLGTNGKGLENNPPQDVHIETDYWIARTHITVDQFACFLNSESYDDESYWDSKGWQWLHERMQEGSAPKLKKTVTNALKASEWLKLQDDWLRQAAWGSRPVSEVSWYEARAYCRWLDRQFRRYYSSELESMLSSIYAGQSPKIPRESAALRIMLPTEAQWERAARAFDAQQIGDGQYPWQSSEPKGAELKANIDDTKIGHASVVNLFQANPIGLADMAGNLWQWQDGTSRKGLENRVGDLSTLDHEILNPALRGGSWDLPAGSARASFRFGVRPHEWFGSVGFRVVLSLGYKDSET